MKENHQPAKKKISAARKSQTPTRTTRASRAASASGRASLVRVLTATDRSDHAAEVGHRARVGNAIVVRAGHDQGDAVEIICRHRRRHLPLARERVPWIRDRHPADEEE